MMAGERGKECGRRDAIAFADPSKRRFGKSWLLREHSRDGFPKFATSGRTGIRNGAGRRFQSAPSISSSPLAMIWTSFIVAVILMNFSSEP